MTKTENAAIILLADECCKLTERCRQLETGYMDLHKRYDKLRAKVEKKDAGDLANVNA